MKNIVCLDVETTGVSQKEDFIIQLAMVKFNPETFEVLGQHDWYIKPIRNYNIQPEAAEKHGITKKFLEEYGVDIRNIAHDIVDFIGDCDILTYNGNHFDIMFLYKDLLMAGVELDLEGRQFFDSYSIYKTLHSSTLEKVYEYYTGNTFENAHNAYSDVMATIEVFKNQMRKEHPYDVMTGMTCNQLLSPENSIRMTKVDNVESIVFNVGKHKDKEFCEVYKNDPLYIKWFGENVATNYTKRILNKYFKEHCTKKVE